MRVTVELFSYFRKGRFEENIVELRPGASVADLLVHLQIELCDVGTLLINGKSVNAKTRLQTGDRVTLIPFIGGG